MGDISWFSYFITYDKNKVELKTIQWFTEVICDEEQVVTLNTFDLRHKRWKKALKISESYENYHGCTLKVYSKIFQYLSDAFVEYFSYMLDIIPQKYVDIINEVHQKRDIIELNFLQVFAQEGNFTIDLRSSSEKSHMTFLTAPFMDVVARQFSMEFYQEEFCLMTTPPESYTSYEKIVLPFDFITWICLLITFGISFMAIFIVNFFSRDKQNVVFGNKVRTPSLNVVGAFFGISQVTLPENNFARMILLLFIYFCLIFRTAYQGMAEYLIK